VDAGGEQERDGGAGYDEKQDIARVPMETDSVSQPSDALEVAFATWGRNARCAFTSERPRPSPTSRPGRWGREREITHAPLADARPWAAALAQTAPQTHPTHSNETCAE